MANRTWKIDIIGDNSSAQKALDGTATHGEATGAKLKSAFSPLGQVFQSLPMFEGPIGQMFSNFSNTAGGMGSQFEKMGEKGKLSLQKIGSAGAGLGMGLAGLGAGLDALASPLESSQKMLDQAISNTGNSADAFKGKIAAADSQMQNFGHRNQETNSALTTLTTGLHSPTLALQEIGKVADIAAAKHESLDTAASAVVKLYAGSTKIMKSFGEAHAEVATKASALDAAHVASEKAAKSLFDIETIDNAQKKALTLPQQIQLTNLKSNYAAALSKETTLHQNALTPQQAFADNMKKIGDATKGQAQASVDSFGGRLDVLKVKVLDGAAQMGQKYGPALMGIGAAMTIVGGAADAFSAVSKGLKSAMVAMGLATDVASTSEDGLAVSAGAADAALGPMLLTIGLVVLAVAAVAAAAYELVTHWSAVWGEIKSIAEGAWHFLDNNVIHPIMDAFSTAVNWIKSHWELLAAILLAPIAPILAAFLLFHKQIMAFFEAIGAKVGQVVDSVVGFFGALPGRAVAALGAVVSFIFAPFITAGTWVDDHVIKPVVSGFTQLPGKLVSGLGDIVGTIFSGLSNAWTWLKTHAYDPIVNGFRALPGDIGSAVGGALNGMAQLGKTIINDIIAGLNKVIDTVDSAIGAISFFGVGLPKHLIPDIPKLATGGLVKGSAAGSLVILGDGGHDERVTPVDGPYAPKSGSAQSVTIHNHIPVSTNADANEIANEIGWSLRGLGFSG